MEEHSSAVCRSQAIVAGCAAVRMAVDAVIEVVAVVGDTVGFGSAAIVLVESRSSGTAGKGM